MQSPADRGGGAGDVGGCSGSGGGNGGLGGAGGAVGFCGVLLRTVKLNTGSVLNLVHEVQLDPRAIAVRSEVA
eukprot:4001553-Prymnesium_polylepis.2